MLLGTAASKAFNTSCLYCHCDDVNPKSGVEMEHELVVFRGTPKASE